MTEIDFIQPKKTVGKLISIDVLDKTRGMTREEAIARIKDHMIVHKMNEPRAIFISEAFNMAIKALEQESKIGHWFIYERPESNREIICSNCDQSIFKYHKLDFDYRPKYCPNCGAKMVESEE